MPYKKLFQPLRHANFLGYVFTKCIIEKTALKARQTKSICAGTMKHGQNLCQTYTNTQKNCRLQPFSGTLQL
jgi:hypothetical protein